ncbi:MAG TPA: hypothetical protein VH092_25905 [Urbifossiella sp.]|nr:hypothetical protein [Urbifossiella sp.]
MTSAGSVAYDQTTLFTIDNRLVRRLPAVRDVAFDPAARSVAVLDPAGAGPGRPGASVVTIHDAAAWVAGEPGKE